MMNSSTLTSMVGTAALSFLLGLLVPFVYKYQKQNEQQHDSAGPQANHGALAPASNATAANANANAPLAIVDGRAPRLIQDASAPVANGQLVPFGNPAINRSFFRELVSQFANILSIIWAYLCPLLNEAYATISELGALLVSIDIWVALCLLVTRTKLVIENFCRESARRVRVARRIISDLQTTMDWILNQHSVKDFLFAIFYIVSVFLGAVLFAFGVTHIMLFRMLSRRPVYRAPCDEMAIADMYMYFLVVYYFLVAIPTEWYVKRHFPWHKLGRPRINVVGIMHNFFIFSVFIAGALFGVCFPFNQLTLQDFFMPGPLRETAHPILFWLRQHSVAS